MFELEHEWVWDFWLAPEGERWHLYFLKADKSLGDPELRHWNVSQGHAISSDLKNWDYQGECFRPAPAPAWDDKTTWTGSVVQDDSGVWHLFYTGSSEADAGKKQRIGHATSPDAHRWQRVGDGLCLDIDTRWYEEYTPGHWHDRAMRDPWVMRDPDSGGWLMYFTARVPGVVEPNEGGAIGLARSPDLLNWTVEPPVWVGGFGQLEVPQVFKQGDQWYCLFCTAAEHWSAAYTAESPTEPLTGTHYLLAEHPLGPWRLAPGRFLDGALPPVRYAGKITQTQEGSVLMGFLHDAPDGSFIGKVSDPLPVAFGEGGLIQQC